MKISEPAGNKMADAKIKGNEDETVLVPLLPTEDFMLQTGTMLVSTLTWFHGEYAVAADKLQARLVALVGANPWLAGCIVRRNGINYLAFKSAGNDEAALAKAAQALFTLVPPEQSPLSRDTPVIQVTSIVREAGYTCQCTLNHPLFAVTVVPCRTNPTSKFAVVVSMSHVAGDGHTFYSLYNYLIGTDENTKGNDKGHTSVMDDCSLPQLKVERIATSLQQTGQVIRDHQTKDDPKQQRLSQEPRELFLAQSPAFLLPTILSVIAAKALKFLSLIAAKVRQTISLNAATVRQGHDRSGSSDCPHTATLHYCWVDGEAMQRLKQETMDQRTAAKDSSTAGCSTSSTNSFVSTNDVFTSWFMLNSGCRHGFMAVNLRGRLSGHDSHHAGNYITVVYYRIPLDCTNPYLIRSSIEPLCRTITSTIPPSRWLGGGAAFATTWATFGSARVTLGENCREELHFPLFGTPLNEHPPNIVMGYIFRARGNQLGMFFVGTPSNLKSLDPCPFAYESDFLTPMENTGTTSHGAKCHVD
jgi:hypothetical protein